jgi:hypothetical protein
VEILIAASSSTGNASEYTENQLPSSSHEETALSKKKPQTPLLSINTFSTPAPALYLVRGAAFYQNHNHKLIFSSS